MPLRVGYAEITLKLKRNSYETKKQILVGKHLPPFGCLARFFEFAKQPNGHWPAKKKRVSVDLANAPNETITVRFALKGKAKQVSTNTGPRSAA